MDLLLLTGMCYHFCEDTAPEKDNCNLIIDVKVSVE